MADDKKEPWLNYLALTTVVFAVCATLSTLKGGAYGSRAMMSQAQASDQWAFFQAKSIKGYVYDLQREKFEMELGALRAGAVPRSVLVAYRQKIDGYAEKARKYESEKEDIRKKAEALEARRDESSRHSAPFGMAAMFLQIAILLSSIAALMKQKYFWFLGMGLGCVGLVYFLNGFFLFT